MLEFVVFIIVIILGLVYIKNSFLKVIFIVIISFIFYFLFFLLTGGIESGLEQSKNDSLYITSTPKNKVCFYIDTLHHASKHIVIGGYVIEEDSNKVVWDFDAYDVMNHKMYANIPIKSFSSKEQCIPYGANIKGVKNNELEALKPSVKYVVHLDTTIEDSDYQANHIEFMDSFRVKE